MELFIAEPGCKAYLSDVKQTCQAQFDKVQHQIDVTSQALAQAQKDLEAAKRKAAAGGN